MDIYHLNFSDGCWMLTREGGSGTVGAFTTKSEALMHSALRMKQSGGALKIHRLDGTVDDERTFAGTHPQMSPKSPASDEREARWIEEPMPGLRPFSFEV